MMLEEEGWKKIESFLEIPGMYTLATLLGIRLEKHNYIVVANN